MKKMNFYKYLDLGLLITGCTLAAFGIAQLGLQAFLIGSGVALITAGLWRDK